MQLDSHRSRFHLDTSNSDNPTHSIYAPPADTTTASFLPDTITTTKMACSSSSSCCKSGKSAALTFTAADGTEMESWWLVRRTHIRHMRRMVKRVLFYSALIEALRVGPDVLVFAGSGSYPERGPHDFGLSYWTAYVMSWLYMCVFIIVYKPLFSWWVTPPQPSDEDEPSTTTTVLRQINMVLLPLNVFIALAEYTYFLIRTFVFVDARPTDATPWSHLPANNKKTWLTRAVLLGSVLFSVWSGHAAFDVLAEYGLARVKCTEYMLIVVPVQINLGILLGSMFQWKREARLERKRKAVEEREVALVLVEEEGVTDEKERLLSV